MPRGADHRHRHRRTVAPRQQVALCTHLLPQDFLNAFGDVALPAAASLRGEEPAAPTSAEVGCDRLPGECGNRHPSPCRLVPKAHIKLVRQLNRGSLHGMPAYHSRRAVAHNRLRIRCLASPSVQLDDVSVLEHVLPRDAQS
jgi:hypothetical protein